MEATETASDGESDSELCQRAHERHGEVKTLIWGVVEGLCCAGCYWMCVEASVPCLLSLLASLCRSQWVGMQME